MTHAGPYILASDDGALFKLAFWGLIILIFGIVKFAKFISKLFSPTNASKPSDVPPAMRNARRPAPLPARAPMPAGTIALPPLPTKAAAKVRRKVARKAAPAQPPAIPTASPFGGIAGALQQTRSAPTAARPVAVSQSRVTGWLDARTIRAQFILSEAMKRPHSLR